MIEKHDNYATFSNAELEEMKRKLQDNLSMIEDEILLRKQADKKKAWGVVVETIEDFCAKHGSIVVIADYGLGISGVNVDIKEDNIDTSTVGTVKIITGMEEGW